MNWMILTRPVALVVLGGGLLVLTRVGFSPSASSRVLFARSDGASGGGDAPNPLPDPELVAALHRIVLTPKALAAAGLSSGQVTAVVTAVKNQLAAAPSELTNADAALANARKASEALTRKVQAGLASAEEI